MNGHILDICAALARALRADVHHTGPQALGIHQTDGHAAGGLLTARASLEANLQSVVDLNYLRTDTGVRMSMADKADFLRAFDTYDFTTNLFVFYVIDHDVAGQPKCPGFVVFKYVEMKTKL